MTGGQALVASLVANGVDTIFALPGVQLDGAFDALYEERDRIRVIHPRHEQAAAYMADGYARTTGKVGACMVVPGPGLLNATAALSTAYACNSPVLCVTGQIQSDLIEFGRGLLHEIPNQLGMIRSVTKHAERATTPPEIPGLVQRAFATMRSGRPRPVEIEIPPDTLFATADVGVLAAAPSPVRSAGDPEPLERAARLLGEARNPLICSGGGVLGSGAWEELRRLAALLQAPVVMTANGKGALSDRDPLAQSILGAMELLRDADVVLAVGTRFVDPATARWGFGPDRTVIQMDVDPEEIGRNYPVTVPIEADAKAGLAALGDLIAEQRRPRPARTAELTALKLRRGRQGARRAAAGGLRDGDPRGAAGRRHPRLRDDAGWLLVASRLPRLRAADLHHAGLPGHARLRVSRPPWAPRSATLTVLSSRSTATAASASASTSSRRWLVMISAAIVVVFTDDAFGNVRRIQQEQFGGRTDRLRLAATRTSSSWPTPLASRAGRRSRRGSCAPRSKPPSGRTSRR